MKPILLRPMAPSRKDDWTPSPRNFPAVRYAFCEGPYDYAAFLQRNWNHPQALLIQEHDVHASFDLVDDLIMCSYPLCSVPYRLYPVTTGWDRVVWSFMVGDAWGEYGDDWATHSGLGLVKISPMVRDIIPAPDVRWSLVDAQVNKNIKSLDLLWHMHWPETEHEHKGAWDATAKVQTD